MRGPLFRSAFYAIVRIDFFDDVRLWDFGWANDLFNHTEATARSERPAVFGILSVVLLDARRLAWPGSQHLRTSSPALASAY
jgi:hypothetical protein